MHTLCMTCLTYLPSHQCLEVVKKKKYIFYSFQKYFNTHTLSGYKTRVADLIIGKYMSYPTRSIVQITWPMKL